MATIQKILQTIEFSLGLESGEVKSTDNLSKDLCMDSLDRVEVLLLLERDLNIRFADDEAYKLETVQDVIDHTMVKVLENYDRR